MKWKKILSGVLACALAFGSVVSVAPAPAAATEIPAETDGAEGTEAGVMPLAEDGVAAAVDPVTVNTAPAGLVYTAPEEERAPKNVEWGGAESRIALTDIADSPVTMEFKDENGTLDVRNIDGVWGFNGQLKSNSATDKFDVYDTENSDTSENPIVISFKIYLKKFEPQRTVLGKGDKQYAIQTTGNGLEWYAGEDWNTVYYRGFTADSLNQWHDVLAVIDSKGRHRIFVDQGTSDEWGNAGSSVKITQREEPFTLGYQIDGTTARRDFTKDIGYLADVKFYGANDLAEGHALKQIDLEALDAQEDKGLSEIQSKLRSVTPNVDFSLDAPYDVETVWRAGDQAMAAGDVFRCGFSHKVTTTFTAKEGYAFATDDTFKNAVKAAVTTGKDNVEATVTSTDGKTMTVEVDYGTLSCKYDAVGIRLEGAGGSVLGQNVFLPLGATKEVSPSIMLEGDRSPDDHTVKYAGVTYEYAVEVGKDAILSAEGRDGKCLLTAKAAGTAKVTVTAKASGNVLFTRNVAVTVGEGTAIAAPGVTLTKPADGAFPTDAEVAAPTGMTLEDRAEDPVALVGKDAETALDIKRFDGRWAFNTQQRTASTDDKFNVTGKEPMVISLKVYLKNIVHHSTLVAKGDRQYMLELVDGGFNICVYDTNWRNNNCTGFTAENESEWKNQWHDVVAVIDKNGKTCIFVDDKASGVNATDGITSNTDMTNQQFAIGWNTEKANEAARVFTTDNGYLADVRFYRGDSLKGIDLTALRSLEDKGLSMIQKTLSSINPTADFSLNPPYETAKTVWSSGEKVMKATDKFKCGNTAYTATTTFTANEGFKFTDDEAFKTAVRDAVETGDDAATVEVDVLDEGTMTVTVTYPSVSCQYNVADIVMESEDDIVLSLGDTATVKKPTGIVLSGNHPLSSHKWYDNVSYEFGLEQGGSDVIGITTAENGDCTITPKKNGEAKVLVMAKVAGETAFTKRLSVQIGDKEIESAPLIAFTAPREGNSPVKTDTKIEDQAKNPVRMKVKDGVSAEIRKFDGIWGFNGQWLSTDASDRLNISGNNPLVISFKVYLKQLASGAQRAIVTKGDNQYAIQVRSDGIEFFVFDETWRAIKYNLSAANESEWKNKWNDVVAVLDASGKTRLFVNGKASSNMGTCTSLASSDVPFAIGFHGSVSGREFTSEFGYLADFKFYGASDLAEGSALRQINLATLDASEDKGLAQIKSTLEGVDPTVDYFIHSSYEEEMTWSAGTEEMTAEEQFACGDTSYKAVMTLTAKNGFKFPTTAAFQALALSKVRTGVDDVTPTVAISADGSTMTVTASYPAIACDNEIAGIEFEEDSISLVQGEDGAIRPISAILSDGRDAAEHPGFGKITYTYAVKEGCESFIEVDRSTGVITAKAEGADLAVVVTASAAGHTPYTKEISVTVLAGNELITEAPAVTLPEPEDGCLPTYAKAQGHNGIALKDRAKVPVELVKVDESSSMDIWNRNGRWGFMDQLKSTATDDKFNVTGKTPIAISFKIFMKNLEHQRSIVSKGDQQYWIEMFNYSGSRGFSFCIYDGGWKCANYISDEFSPARESEWKNRWHDVVAVMDANGKIRLYVDGKPSNKAETRGITTNEASIAREFAIGYNTEKPERIFRAENGYLADVRFYQGDRLATIDLDALDASADKGYASILAKLATVEPTADFALQPKYEVKTEWADAEGNALTESDVLECGTAYTAKVTYAANGGYAFPTENNASFKAAVAAGLHAEKAEVTAGDVVVSENGKTVTVTVSYPPLSCGSILDLKMEKSFLALATGAAKPLLAPTKIILSGGRDEADHKGLNGISYQYGVAKGGEEIIGVEKSESGCIVNALKAGDANVIVSVISKRGETLYRKAIPVKVMDRVKLKGVSLGYQMPQAGNYPLPASVKSAEGYDFIADWTDDAAELKHLGEGQAEIGVQDGVRYFNDALATESGNDKFDVVGEDPLAISLKLFLKELPSSEDEQTILRKGSQYVFVVKKEGNQTKLIFYMNSAIGTDLWPQAEYNLDEGFLNKWHDILIVVDGKGEQASMGFSVDGAPFTLNEREGRLAKLKHFDDPFAIGCNGAQTPGGRFTLGYLADIAFYSGAGEAMTAEQKESLHLSALEESEEGNAAAFIRNMLETVEPTAMISMAPYDVKTVWSKMDGTLLGAGEQFNGKDVYVVKTTLTAHELAAFHQDCTATIVTGAEGNSEIAASQKATVAEDGKTMVITVTYAKAAETPEVAYDAPVEGVTPTEPAITPSDPDKASFSAETVWKKDGVEMKETEQFGNPEKNLYTVETVFTAKSGYLFRSDEAFIADVRGNVKTGLNEGDAAIDILVSKDKKTMTVKVSYPTNVALGKAAETSSGADGKDAVDGNEDTVCSITGDAKWISIDLKAQTTLAKSMKLKFADGQQAADYRVETSADKEEWTEVCKKSDATSEGSVDSIAVAALASLKRYVRVSFTSEGAVGVQEIEIVGIQTGVIYKATFDKGDGSEAVTQDIVAGKTVERPKDPTRNGYAFKYWYVDVESEPYDFDTVVTGDITLHAKWVKTWTVSFDTNGGAPEISAKTVEEGSTAEKPVDPKKADVVFGGWFEDNGTFQNAYAFDTKVTKDITLYAKWQAMVRFMRNDGSEEDVMLDEQKIDLGTAPKKPADPTGKEGFEFVGWFMDAEGTGSAFNFETGKVEKNTTLYAKWAKKKYTVTFETNGGTKVDPKKVEHGMTVDEPETTRDGFIFKGWYTDEKLQNEYNFEAKVTKDLTLYARWISEDDICTVTFHTNEEGVTAESQEVEKGQLVKRPTVNGTKEHYQIEGWYKDEACTMKFDFAKDTVEGNLDLYAKWEKKTYRVTFNTNVPDLTAEPQNVLALEHISAPELTRDGYTLVGWYKDEACTESEKFDFEKDVVESSMTLYAKWEKDEKPTVDKTALNKAIEDAEKLVAEDYTAGTWSALQTALQAAKTAAESDTVDQAAVNQAKADLDQAMKNLKTKAKETAEKNVAADKEALTLPEIGTNDTLSLPTQGANGSKITWVSDSDAIKVEGGVATIIRGDAEQTVTLKATITFGEGKDAVSVTKEFTVKIPAKGAGSVSPTDPETEAEKANVQKELDAMKAIIDAGNANGLYPAAAWTAFVNAYNELKAEYDKGNLSVEALKALTQKLMEAQKNLKASAEKKVTGIRFAQKKYQIAKGKKIDLKKEVTIVPADATNKSLTYTLDKKSAKYATLKNGIVTTKKSGAGKTVKVTVTSADGSVRQTVSIQIMKNAVTKVTVKGKKKVTVKAGKSYTVKTAVKTNGKKANKKLKWTSSNEKFATVNAKGKVRTKKAGAGKTVKITAVSTDGTNKKVQVTIKIKK